MSIACPRTLQDLDPRDVTVLWDLIRFGALTDYQIERRYSGPNIARARLPVLLDEGIVSPTDPWLPGVEAYQATSHGFYLGRFGLKRHNLRYGQLGHDLAVVDLADALIAAHPTATWCTEQQIPRALLIAGNGARVDPRTYARTPDGLLVDGGRLVAVELEHSIKSAFAYSTICRWYALEDRIHELWWFTDAPAIADRIRAVTRAEGFANDIAIRIEPFPPGVVVRERPKP